MIKVLHFFKSPASAFIICAGIIGVSILLLLGPQPELYPELYIGITYDLMLLSPIVYLLIIRNSRIPNITVIPVFLLGTIVAGTLLPDSNKQHYEFLMTYFLPLVELGVVSYIIWKAYKLSSTVKKNQNTDFLTSFLQAGGEVVKSPRLLSVLATEVSMFYYALFVWSRPKQIYTHYKENGVVAILWTLIFILLAETVAIHFLVMKWNVVVAWIFTGTSVYAALQILGHLKALSRRVSFVQNDELILRYGLFGDITVKREEIDRIEHTSKEVEGKGVKQLAILNGIEHYNTVIYFKSTQTLRSAYGLKRRCDVLLLQVDQKEEFKSELSDHYPSV